MWSLPWPSSSSKQIKRTLQYSSKTGGGAKCGCNQNSRETEYNSSAMAPNFTHVYVKQNKRPLLVRFDWYSRSHTPVHIG